MRFSLLVVSAVIVVAWAGIASAQTLPAGVTRGASVEGVTEYRLHNGLRVLLFPDPARATTTVNIVYLAGSRHEDYGDTGIAHLVEHLVSYGSPRHPDAKAEQAARGAGKLLGAVPTGAHSARSLLDRGYDLVIPDVDTLLLREGARASLAALRA